MSLTTPINHDDHVMGSADAPIVLLEYGDYQCPYCAQAHLAVDDLQRRLGEQLCVVYRHFPLTELHPFAELAAEAAEAAGAQGKFWEMHDALFDYQTQFGPELIPVLAESLDLDVTRLRDDMLAHRFRDRVQRDAADALRDGAQGTPTFYINGERHEGNSDELSLAEAIMRYVA